MGVVNDDSRIRRNPLAAPVVAMIGGGQLARMTHQAAVALGQTLRVLAADPLDPAAQVTPDVVIGAHDDPDAVRTAAEGADVMTFDHEHVPPQILLDLEAAGVAVRPRASALIHAQDKLVMRRALAEIGAPVPPFTGVESLDDVRRFHAEQDGRIVLKAARGGYDGRGVWMPDSLEEAERIADEQLAAGVPMMAEARVPWTRELSAMVARSPFGQGAVWPVVETVQRDGICSVVIAPAPGLPDDLRSAVQATALRLAEHLDVTGVMAVELFEVIGSDGRPGVLVNELAMRPHNSGHWTMDGATTSQFEQHLRAVLDYPLGSTVPTAPLAVMANVLGAPETPEMSMDERVHHLGARFPHAKVHLYGKSERHGRKIGHVNVLSDPGVDPDDGDQVSAVRAVAELAAHWLSHGVWADGWDPHSGAPTGDFDR
ncbi:5-(carboxyamino)imidazole ribonucleotide synthase [Dietzia sp. ANT_WB102]|uniref:5-(carboxyamino)imidazole ribonucleotide synthase n=1 Tax=Dietzia sp. ANT_WB102 TaxID=2597345 RepID=UPI0011EBFFB8|nr:5-(carboxyamino)imidazole ribonucleotide synthase [Dietzia sp. ANT_WB102]KAA0917026.1 5-(carboxyamino)imidazole ribonucleotide synthase [Dietzia sp. ANT_WB102]